MRIVYKLLKEYIPSLIIAIVIALSLNTYVAQAVKVPTESMDPTIEVNDRLVLEKLTLGNLKHGDIVAFWPPLPSNSDRYIKRLIGLPGDTIEIKDGVLYRNGNKVDEPYVKEKMNYTFARVTVPSEHYFFLGDNRNASYDSHAWPTPFVESKKLIGKALFRYFPLNHLGSID